MKIILASDLSFLLKYGYDLTRIPKEQMKIGYVTTASKGARTDFNQKLQNTIRENGYNFEPIDIESKTKGELMEFFKDKNIIHIEGGSSFYLLRAIRQTGFAEIIQDLLDRGVVYIGTSAGAYVMCQTIGFASWYNDENQKFGVTDLTALGYAPFILKVHYTDEKELEVKEIMKNTKHPVKILRDGQGILIEDGNCIFYGDGEEVKLNKN